MVDFRFDQKKIKFDLTRPIKSDCQPSILVWHFGYHPRIWLKITKKTQRNVHCEEWGRRVERVQDALPGSWLATSQALLIQAATAQKDKIKAI